MTLKAMSSYNKAQSRSSTKVICKLYEIKKYMYKLYT